MSNTQTRKPTAFPGRAQLSLVEHALTPLNPRESLKSNLRFETGFHYTDVHRNRKRAKVAVSAVHGLSASDDLYLWGLLGLAFAQSEPSADFYATPYWCLKQLGIVHGSKKGREEYRIFRDAVRRLAGARYTCDAFYDPMRHEHREVSFGFLSYSLPQSNGVSRAWRFAWDPIFWELCSATAGALRFDMPTYRSLSPAARRLFLFLKKQFWRSDQSPDLELRDLAVSVLGFSDTSPTKELRRKITSAAQELFTHEIVQLGIGQRNVDDCITKRSKGVFTLKLYRGPAFNRKTPVALPEIEDSPLYDPLVAIGFDVASIRRILKEYSPKLIQLWADITLAAVEQGRVADSPQAFFQYYISRAAERRSTPPDWWREIDRRRRHEEDQQRHAREARHTQSETAKTFEAYLAGEAQDAFHRVMQQLKADLLRAGKSDGEAAAFAREHALVHFRNRFLQSHTATVKRSPANSLEQI